MNKQQLASTIWQSANQMRSKIEANEYKDYILGFMFYKYLSDREISFLKGEKYSDEDIKKVTADDEKLVKHISENIGYFIAYEDLFSSWLSKGDDFDVSDVRDALSNFDANIEPTYKKLFENIFKTLQSGLSKLGETSTKQTKSIKALLKLIKRIPMDGKQDYDVLGFIYEYLISMFAANAGKKAGEFYTPHEVSVLMSEIVANHLKDREHIKIYDPTSGSGSLLINIGASMAQYIEGDRHATPSNIDDRGTFTELKKSVNKTKAENFFRLVFKDDYVPLRLPIYSENYLRDFIFSGGKDPYLNVIEVEQTSAYTPDDAREYNKPKVVVVKLTDNDYVGREIRTSVSYKTLENWYSESNAVKSVIESECFAYVEDKLCVATSECLERTDDGKIRLTEYAKTHEEECFLQFIVDEKDGTLHYVKLPKSKADEAFNYNDAITEDLLSQYGLVNEMSKEMLNAIDGEEFGPALDILMDKHICNYTARLLRSITGLDNRTISNMKKGENLTKSNVISACLL